VARFQVRFCDFRFCVSCRAAFIFVIFLIAADTTSEEWKQIIATVQQHNLTWLDLGKNEIVVIPDSIAQLRNLKALYLHCVICVVCVIAVRM
jgi:hypothetical protein